MPLVSVIMPSLNVGKYIHQCLKSVTNQTLKDLEILIIDAGSTDGTLEILEEYSKQDSRIKLIHSQKKSYGYQVNFGIEMATGDYIGIVETDDYIEPDMYETLYKIAIEHNVDYVKGQGCFEEWLWESDYRTRPIINYEFVQADTVMTPCEHPELQYYDYYLWLGLYKSSFIKRIKLNETPGAAFQDVGFAIKCHSLAQKAIYVDKLVYHYRFGSEGASSVSHKGFRYILQEYKLNKEYLDSLDDSFVSAYYKKMFLQIRSRHYQMAYGESFWQDALEENEELQVIFRQLVEGNLIDASIFDEAEWSCLSLFLESPLALYGAVALGQKININKIDSIKKKINRCKGAVLVGTGLRSRYPYALVKRNNLGEIVAVCDNETKKQGTYFYETKISSVDSATEKYIDAFYLITSRKYGEEIKAQLIHKGIKECNIYIFDLGEDMNYLK